MFDENNLNYYNNQKFKIKPRQASPEQFKIALLTPFMSMGLEEWISDNELFLTKVKCSTSFGIINDQTIIDVFMQTDFYKQRKDRIFKVFLNEKGEKNLRFQSGVVIKINKDHLIKTCRTKSS